ncbi:TIGR01621 family pseudouridine synthase [Spongiibacter sp. KMU-158]|uniref:TIGR01621 family pseudouridine synthase n=1 Tax=Spongiibacter pelagi TaxID=2760804 RepID=A0A927C0T9_9GAMM|nr:TIGR01621 family pseudouridine synthase [Spongiibacter pelagi]MBD2859153.1 TIGR01621 family pseudouridine synthase [Spongiibacter pelagi]
MSSNKNWFRLHAETRDFIVIEKAAGANLHRNQRGVSLLDILKQDYPNVSLSLVHRLDDATSGLLLIARHAEAAAELSAQFSRREVEKYYLAIARGKPSKKQGAVIGDMEKSRNGSYRLSRSKNNPAISYFHSSAIGEGRRVYLLRPKTGKTHQLRVALKSLGVPISGDERYGGELADRCYLHSMVLGFSYKGKAFRYCAVPEQGRLWDNDGLREALLQYAQPWSLQWPK